MKKKNKRHQVGWGLQTLFLVILTGFQVYFIFNDAFTHTGNLMKDIISCLVCSFLTLDSYWEMKNVGTSEDDDERDQFVQTKTEAQMFKIMNWLLFILGASGIIGGTFLVNHSYPDQGYGLVIAAIPLLVIWELSFVIELILIFINYRRN